MAYVASLFAAALLVAAQVPSTSLDFETYRTRVEPIFLKPRAPLGPGGTCFLCHTHVTSRFRLQPPASGAAWTEQQSRRNFEAVSRIVVPGDPMKSRLLLHPLAADAGGDPVHLGGKHWTSQSDPEWVTIADWIRSAAPSRNAESSAATVDFEIFKTRVQPIFLAKRKGHARCYACHGQGTGFRLQTLAAGSASWSEEQSRLNYEAIQRLVVAGDPESSRLLMVPLEEEAGGDPFHPGGKHWKSRNDPEWQALAAWIRGPK